MLQAAKEPRSSAKEQKLLIIESRDGSEASRVERFDAIADVLRAGDVIVLNDAATFPASLQALTAAGSRVELRLLPKAPRDTFWSAILFGEGDWRLKTEDRPAPPVLQAGSELRIGAGVVATIVDVSALSPRWVRIRFNRKEAEIWSELYRYGKPIQYSYLKKDLELWSVQNSYSARPWASELPSAGHPLTFELLLKLQKKGVIVGRVTHSTGISSTGDPVLDSHLPLPEFFQIPEETVLAVEDARARGNRVIAIGTSVVRALESQTHQNAGKLIAGYGETDLLIHRDFKLRVVDGIVSGIHDLGESHFRLLEAFAPQERLQQGLDLARDSGLLTHEFGDSCLILRKENI